MKIFIALFTMVLMMAACNAPRKSSAETAVVKDSVVIVETKIVGLPAGTSPCVLKLIKTFSEEAVQNPPRKIIQYNYKGQKVYYVPAICCDFFSDLYDSNCKLIGHPDGGLTGKGDGKLPDFATAATNKKLVWEDQRK